MLSPKFYMLIGALESARAFIERYYRDLTPYTPTGATDPRPEWGEGDDVVSFIATGDAHLDPDPGTAAAAAARLPILRDALLKAEGDLSIDLFAAREMPNLTDADKEKVDKSRAKAWKKFSDAVTDQSFILAKVVRRLMWVSIQDATGVVVAGTGVAEWEMMDQRLQRILTAFAEVGLGGGEDNPALKGPGILGSSDESISF